jgi:hypothetical protein
LFSATSTRAVSSKLFRWGRGPIIKFDDDDFHSSSSKTARIPQVK